VDLTLIPWIPDAQDQTGALHPRATVGTGPQGHRGHWTTALPFHWLTGTIAPLGHKTINSPDHSGSELRGHSTSPSQSHGLLAGLPSCLLRVGMAEILHMLCQNTENQA